MPKYEVLIPIAGMMAVEVEADNETEAMEKAMDTDIDMANVHELNKYEKAIDGNVCNLEYTEIQVEEIDDGDDSSENPEG